MLPLVAAMLLPCIAHAQASSTPAPIDATRIDALEQRLARLQSELDSLRTELAAAKSQSQPANTSVILSAARSAQPKDLHLSSAATTAPTPAAQPAITQPTPTAIAAATPAPAEATPKQFPLLPANSTLNLTFDGYYGYNFNHPVGRVNYLHAYDVLSNSFNLNQAAVLFELPTDPDNHRRFGMRLDLQFGQATETLQGNPANENRPDIYRNIFQAYGRYIAPLGHGLTVDFGKWASSLGYEGNYTKDQLNYSRSFFFNYLPFYHTGFRATYPITGKLAANYWIINGPEQSEPVNGFHDQMFGFALTPTKNISWTANYYLGQEHPDAQQATNCTIPVQPGLCFAPITNPGNGKLHIFDNYLTVQATPKLLFVLEGDYVIQRQWASAAPGESSAPSHVIGYAAYTQYQFNSRTSLTARNEYLSDRGGLFSNATQALKEGTLTLRYNLGDGFLVMTEYRRDWTNIPFFPTGNAGRTTNHQDIATLGLVWYYGNKQGSW